MDKERIVRELIAAGGQEWGILAEAVDDIAFKSILTDQEKDILKSLFERPGMVNGYRNYFVEILAKYIAWSVYKKSNISDISQETQKLIASIKKSEDKLKIISDSATYIGGATVLVEYSKAFANTAKTHELKAKWQGIFYFISIIFFAIVVGLIFFFSISDFSFFKKIMADDIKSLPLNTAFFTLKIFLIVFVYQITQFFRKNYGAEKHLQEVYQHRSDVLQSLHAVYNALTDTQEKDKILSAGALFAYERGETGYITTKEGAGAGDSIIETLLGRNLK